MITPNIIRMLLLGQAFDCLSCTQTGVGYKAHALRLLPGVWITRLTQSMCYRLHKYYKIPGIISQQTVKYKEWQKQSHNAGNASKLTFYFLCLQLWLTITFIDENNGFVYHKGIIVQFERRSADEKG
jgi:hypothetical protein